MLRYFLRALLASAFSYRRVYHDPDRRLMKASRQVAAATLSTIFATVVAGCAVVDQYSGRAVVYNLEAEQTLEQGLLLNVVRAYLRRPMQFTTVSTITGVASASAGVQYTLPTNVPFRPATQGATGIAAFPPLPTWLFSGSMSGGPAFTVPVLDTQEFYQGILKAIPGQIWDLYIQANYPADLLFNVFVQKVVMHTGDDETCHTNKCEFVFANYPGEEIQIEMFQAFAEYLLELGLTTEQSKPRPVKFENTASLNIRYVGNETSDGKVQVLGPPGGSAPSEAPPAARPFKICFAPPTTPTEKFVDKDSHCGNTKQAKPKPESKEGERPDGTIATSGAASLSASDEFIPELIRRYPWMKGRLASLPKKPEKVKITIYMRSTEGMIYYLGELARRQFNDRDPEHPRETFEKEYEAYETKDTEPCTHPSDVCRHIFHLHKGAAPEPGAVVSVFYDGQWFSLPSSTPSQIDRSSMTFEFLKQQIALNSSAKGLPQSSVITSAGP
jgi:hypothetical protein